MNLAPATRIGPRSKQRRADLVVPRAPLVNAVEPRHRRVLSVTNPEHFAGYESAEPFVLRSGITGQLAYAIEPAIQEVAARDIRPCYRQPHPADVRCAQGGSGPRTPIPADGRAVLLQRKQAAPDPS